MSRFPGEKVPSLQSNPPNEHKCAVEQVVAMARHFGLRSEADIARYALSAALLGTNFFETMGGVREILEMNEPAEYRAKLLEYFTREMFDILGQR